MRYIATFNLCQAPCKTQKTFCSSVRQQTARSQLLNILLRRYQSVETLIFPQRTMQPSNISFAEPIQRNTLPGSHDYSVYRSLILTMWKLIVAKNAIQPSRMPSNNGVVDMPCRGTHTCCCNVVQYNIWNIIYIFIIPVLIIIIIIIIITFFFLFFFFGRFFFIYIIIINYYYYFFVVFYNK